MLLEKHERFHKLGLSDLKWDAKPVTEVLVQRQTAMTGETLSIAVPLYADDTREVLNDRMGLFFSIMQDRMEDENERVMELEQQVTEQRRAAEAKKQADLQAKRQAKLEENAAKKAKWKKPLVEGVSPQA